MCKLKKSLYGLKQTPMQWYKKFDSFMGNRGFSKTTCDHCIFVKKFGDNDFIILLLYMNDMLIVGQNASKIDNLKRELSKSFATNDLGLAKQILGMRISRNRKSGKLWLSQEAYVERVLEIFNMNKTKSVYSPLASHFKLGSENCPTSAKEKQEIRGVPYDSTIGSLMYAMVCIRLDIAHIVGVVSWFLSNLGKEHQTTVKWIFRYLKGTSKTCLCFGGDKPMLQVHRYADVGANVDFRKSLSGYLLTFAGEQSHGSPDLVVSCFVYYRSRVYCNH